MGPYRTKPLDVLEQEIDQLNEIYPGTFLQFTDDNLACKSKLQRRIASDAPPEKAAFRHYGNCRSVLRQRSYGGDGVVRLLGRGGWGRVCR